MFLQIYSKYLQQTSQRLSDFFFATSNDVNSMFDSSLDVKEVWSVHSNNIIRQWVIKQKHQLNRYLSVLSSFPSTRNLKRCGTLRQYFVLFLNWTSLVRLLFTKRASGVHNYQSEIFYEVCSMTVRFIFWDVFISFFSCVLLICSVFFFLYIKALYSLLTNTDFAQCWTR